jgi:septal ring factor EnvC (AmiA/AmiB activator)
MKTNDLRGMRDIPTIQMLRHRSLPTTREQTVAELARLEHEKARLKRELNLWLEHQERTEKQLQQVEDRLDILHQIMDQSSTERSTKPEGQGRAQGRRSATGKADSSEGEERGWQEISLEY